MVDLHWVGILLLCSSLPAMCAGGDDRDTAPQHIWGQTILARTGDKGPVREVITPPWLANTTRFVHCIKDVQAYDEAAAAGAQMTEVFFAEVAGVADYMRYPSKLGPKDPKIPKDQVAKEIAAYKSRGIRVLAIVWPCFLSQAYRDHPDWRIISTNTTVIPNVDLSKAGYWEGRLCVLGPWGDYLIEIMAEILNLYPEVDGFCFDGLQHTGVCYCQHCRDAYRKDTGYGIPDVNMNDPEFRRYQLWEDRKVEELVERMQARIKSIKPDAVLVPWTTNSGRMMQLSWIPHTMSDRMNLLFDAPAMELWLDECHIGNSVVPAFSNAYLWALTNFRTAFSEPYLMTHMAPYGTDSFPPQEEMRRALQVLTYGCRPNISISWPNHLKSSLECVKAVKELSPYMTDIQPERWAGLVMSDQTRTFYGRDGSKVERRYLANVFGAFRAAMEEHLAFNMVTDWQLTPDELAKYKVLVLPNTACLSQGQADAIEQYVRDGGGLVATVDASLFDEMGSPRKDFALADVFGAHYQGVPSTTGDKMGEADPTFVKGVDSDYWEKRDIVAEFQMSDHAMFDNERLRSYCGSSSVVCRGQAVSVGPLGPDARAIATFSVRRQMYEPARTDQSSPAVVVRNCGNGKVVYIAAGLDSGYYLYPFTYQRMVLAQAIRWAAGKPQPITVEAPMCVQTTFFRQANDGHERLIVHLFNDLNSTGNHAKPNDDIPQREEVIPLSGIKVAFKGYDIRHVRLEPEGVELTTKKTNDGLLVTVPKLLIHSMVVAEIGKGGAR